MNSKLDITKIMKYRTRKLVKPEDLNTRRTLFGGRVLQWVDEEAAIFAMCQLGSPNIVTKAMSEINFVSTAVLGDIIEFGMELVNVGTTSISMACDVRNKITKQSIIKIDKIVFVLLDENGNPKPHGKKKISNEPKKEVMKGKLVKQDNQWYVTRLEENEWETFYPLSFEDVNEINSWEQIFDNVEARIANDQDVEFEFEEHWETGLEGVIKMAKIVKK
jgi:acyl-CoA hydrolase